MSGAELVALERQRQIDVEGFDAESDSHEDLGQLALAAACYAIDAVNREDMSDFIAARPRDIWPWDRKFWKPASAIRMLVKAGALICAEIDRRLAAGEKP